MIFAGEGSAKDMVRFRKRQPPGDREAFYLPISRFVGHLLIAESVTQTGEDDRKIVRPEVDALNT